jgi:putative transferase (TIGR04331 family)
LFLATTADQRFWKKDEKIIFLGEWCKLFNQKPVWSQLNYEVFPYHWRSRTKYFEDYVRLEQLYEHWLPVLAKNLNTLHSENHSDRYWRIVLGPWLYYFIQTFYDRYLSIRRAIDSRQVTLTWISPVGNTDFTPKDFSTFGKWLSSDYYNLHIYSWLIEAMGGIAVEVKSHSIQPERISLRADLGLSNRIKLGLKQVMGIYSRCLPQKDTDIVLASLYIRKQDLVRLQLALGQFPNLHFPKVMSRENVSSSELRKKLEVPAGDDEFTSLLGRFVPSQIPMAYLENYSNLKERAEEAFPKNPKIIVSVNAHYFHEGFKVWCAGQVEKGAKLIGTQHGAHYGNALWSANETHEKKVADRYFSWGWDDEKMPSITPLSSVQLVGTQKRIRVDGQGGILWLGLSRPRYSSWMASAPVSCEMLDYVEDQKIFLETLGSEPKNILTMRLFHTDYDWGVRERLMEGLSDLRFSDGSETMFQQLCESRLCIASYNATPILETISANFPTVAFWNFDHWELRKSERPYFDDMVRVGIFHDNPKSAASKVNEIYQDPMSWWLSPEVQESKNRFCHRFARTSPGWLSEWKEEILRIAGE